MPGASQFVTAGRSNRLINCVVAIIVLTLAISLPLGAQGGHNGPPSTTTFGGHFLAPAPSVTSVGGRHLPPPTPSVTSIPNQGLQFHRNGQGFHGDRGRGFRNGGFAYGYPYYYPLDDAGAYGYDYVGDGGPDLYSGPPMGPDQNPHIVVEQPPARQYNGYPPDQQAYAAPPQPDPPPAPSAADLKPGEPTVLVFHDGHKQEVTNYAIMGDTLYAFDKGRQKIALADLDMTATVKANDAQGLEFRVPASASTTPAKKKSPTTPQSTTPEQSNSAPPHIASAMP